KTAGMDGAAQALTDTLFVSFDEALREQGTGDMGMGRRMKAIANAFFGRLTVYSAARDKAALAEALAKNIWRGGAVDGRVNLLAEYVAGARAYLGRGNLAAGELDFGPIPEAGP
ncbi:MAG: ubiquinol-cytochrome C chaperone, partial [Alphaproteobacteria bacterium]|nr:ubiquinol-cytochrome C chaperone [Alphaproteobacteria bacterium]